MAIGEASFVLVIAAALAALILAPPADANQIRVTTPNDEQGLGRGTGCSVREAITAANTDASFGGCRRGHGSDTIRIPGGKHRVLQGPQALPDDDTNFGGDLDILTPMRIIGGVVKETRIYADGYRVIDHHSGGLLTLTRIRLARGGDPLGSPGGDIRNLRGTLKLFRTTIGSGTATVGGGLANYADSRIVNSTFRDNRAQQHGGALWAAPGSATTLRSTTITRNRADHANSGIGEGGGVYRATGAEMRIYDTIISGNIDGSEDAADQSPDCYSQNARLLLRFSLVGAFQRTRCRISAASGQNLFNVDPRLMLVGVPDGYGGQLQLFGLRRDSPAINRGGARGRDVCARRDQRGAPRRLGGRCDIGAYERIKCRGKLVTFVGTPGRDRLWADAGPDGVLGLGGSDQISGSWGDDGLCGGAGNDRLFGDEGSDALSGGGGRDVCDGGPGRDRRARGCETRRRVP